MKPAAWHSAIWRVFWLLLTTVTWQISSPAALLSSARAQSTPMSERAITFKGHGDVTLAGSLLVPTHRSDIRLPGVVLVAGSGPTDRDGNSRLIAVKIDLLKQIANLLAEEGVASLRYDKRGQYGSGKAPTDRQLLTDFCAWQNYVGDSLAALATLQEQAEIDPRRTAMVGRSEGGMLVLQAATDTRGVCEPPCALVLISTPARRAEVVIREQVARDLLARFFLKKNDEILEAVKSSGHVPDDVPFPLAAFYPAELGKFLQGMLAHDGQALAERFSGPVLVLAGEKDLQHNVDLEVAGLRAGLEKRQSADHEIY